MENLKFLNVITELIGWPVVETETGAALGVVTDVAVHSANGELTALLLLTNQGRQAAILAGSFQVDETARQVGALLDALLVGVEIERRLPASLAVCRDLLACEVVTREGKLLGQIREAYLALTQPPKLIYCLSEPGLLRLLKRTHYLASVAPYFYSRIDHRLIVPEITETQLLRRSLAEAASQIAPPLRSCTADAGVQRA